MKSPLLLIIAAMAAGALVSLAQTPRASSPPPGALSQYATADALWFHIQELQKGPTSQPKTAQEYQTAVADAVEQINSCAREFLKRYPEDPRKWDARLLQVQSGISMNRILRARDDAAEARQWQELANEKDAPASVRGHARYELIGLSLRNYKGGDNSVTADSILAQLKQFMADFPTYPSLDVMKYQVAEILNGGDPAASETLLKELAGSGEGKIADQARKELATRDRLKSPLDLRFTAVDGAQVDISKMRGKVVLVDFWATWPGPCRTELPNILAAYKKLHEKGFEVVGISLDKSKDALLKFIAQNGMPWPEYFDGKEWENAISSSFAVESVPTMWLVNKKGYVVSTNARADLEGQVEKLLAEDSK